LSRPDNPLVDIENYARLRCPTLLLCATNGPSAADNREFRHHADAVPCVDVVSVDGPHTLNYEHPELVARHIRQFLGG
jgi:pimeloyl-ACP methyl ester carboxylesterase